MLWHMGDTLGNSALGTVLHEGNVHLTSISRLHSSEMQAHGGSQGEISYSVLLLLAPQVARAGHDISLNVRHSILFPTLQKTVMWIPT